MKCDAPLACLKHLQRRAAVLPGSETDFSSLTDEDWTVKIKHLQYDLMTKTQLKGLNVNVLCDVFYDAPTGKLLCCSS